MRRRESRGDDFEMRKIDVPQWKRGGDKAVVHAWPIGTVDYTHVDAAAAVATGSANGSTEEVVKRPVASKSVNTKGMGKDGRIGRMRKARQHRVRNLKNSKIETLVKNAKQNIESLRRRRIF